MTGNLDNLSSSLNEWGYTAEVWASFSPAKRWKIKNPERVKEHVQRFIKARREKDLASGFARPHWLRVSDFDRIKEMTPDEALAEFSRLKEIHLEKRRAAHRANPQKSRDAYSRHKERNKMFAKKANRRRWERFKNNPDAYKRYLEAARERHRKRRREGLVSVCDPEKVREKDRRKYQRKKLQKLAQTDPQALRKMISPMLPSYFIASARMDVTAQVMTWALERKIPFNDLAAWVKKAVTEYNRQYDHFKNVSIDAPITGTDNLTRADLIDSEAFHF
ncbi:hypothetical protein ACLBWS_17770 [Brucellaceae bacterium D45D]